MNTYNIPVLLTLGAAGVGGGGRRGVIRYEAGNVGESGEIEMDNTIVQEITVNTV